jgi:Zn finger protein HypA/HybF involved in hydrogenase expression
MKEFLINSRSRAVLDLIDAFELTESELVDIRDGVYNRVSELRNNLTVGDVTCECYRCKGLGAIHMMDDTADDTCPVCDGSGELICDELELTNLDLELTNLDLSSLEHEEINVIGVPDEGEFCPKCKGEGYLKDREGELYECPECDGTGAGIEYSVEVEKSDPDDIPF